MRRFLRDNGLTIAMLELLPDFFACQSATGYRVHNQDQTDHGAATISYGDYLTTGHFVEATFENWESEFLQMAAYVLLTVFLVQTRLVRVEARKADAATRTREHRDGPDAPWPVRRRAVA